MVKSFQGLKLCWPEQVGPSDISVEGSLIQEGQSSNGKVQELWNWW